MIKKIKWNNHCSLGNLELDFTKGDGSAYNTIILAGENGTGKTTILETLSEFLSGLSIQPFDYIDYEVAGVGYHIIPEKNNSLLGFHKRSVVGTKEYENVYTGRNNNEKELRNDTKDLRSYGFAYSKARSGFKTGQVKSVTNQQVDADKFEPDESDDFTRIKQMIIDIEQQDDAAWRNESLQGDISDEKYKDFVKNRSKGYRFKKAFNEFFENVSFARIDNDNIQEKRILFEKYGREIPLDQLSTGEKQIVFRGAHLLRNINNIIGGTILIDEPELSMHPMWQKRILGYYRGLFTYNGNQNVQIIVATHSEYVLRSALEDCNNVLVISLSDISGIIKPHKISAPNILNTLTAAEINYMAFNIVTVDYHIELYGYLQTKENKHSIKECDDFIAQSCSFNPSLHSKPDSYRNTYYKTLPTYIRNAIDHPDSNRTYTDKELRISIELLIDLCK